VKGLTKFFVDIGPLAIFFIFYKTTGSILEAIIPLMIATTIAVLISYIIEKKIPIMPTVGAFIILIFGGLTWYFKNPIFIFLKPTIINLLFAMILYLGILLKKPLLKNLLGANLKLADEGWTILTKRWISLFIVLAILNEIVWRNFSEELWVNFKVFGITTIIFIFTLAQISIIKKFQIEN
jgi:intracellular septation protein